MHLEPEPEVAISRTRPSRHACSVGSPSSPSQSNVSPPHLAVLAAAQLAAAHAMAKQGFAPAERDKLVVQAFGPREYNISPPPRGALLGDDINDALDSAGAGDDMLLVNANTLKGQSGAARKQGPGTRRAQRPVDANVVAEWCTQEESATPDFRGALLGDNVDDALAGAGAGRVDVFVFAVAAVRFEDQVRLVHHPKPSRPSVIVLLWQHGNAPPPVQYAVAEPLVTLLAHPSHTVRVNTAWALRCLYYSTPLRLPKTIPRGASHPDCVLRSTAPSSLESAIPARPLYVSDDVPTKVLDMAITLLKWAEEYDVRIAGTEVEVAWAALAAFMLLGPNFLMSKDAGAGTPSGGSCCMSARAPWSAMLRFLRHNSGTLVTLDVARRIASVLSNALLFANNFISPAVQDALGLSDPALQQALQHAQKGLPLLAREALLRRWATLLQSCVTLFASPDGYAGVGSAVQAAIATSSGTFTGVWAGGDEYTHGVTFIEIGDELEKEGKKGKEKDQLNRESVEVAIDSLLRKPVPGACKHDPLSLCQARIPNAEHQPEELPPSTTSVVDTAIELFAQLLPLQDLASTIKNHVTSRVCAIAEAGDERGEEGSCLHQCCGRLVPYIAMLAAWPQAGYSRRLRCSFPFLPSHICHDGSRMALESDLKSFPKLKSFELVSNAAILGNYPAQMTILNKPSVPYILDMGAVEVLRGERGVPPTTSRVLTSSRAPWTLAENPPATDFAFSNTRLQAFVLAASRTLMTDRFFTTDYTAATYTQEGRPRQLGLRAVIRRNIR
ncbi:hypothetical protein B0H11DRAFT_2263553 [Mycena galericulata]|nr:hypothetical protein B0H11DRAFT_2263553 [Mycena galericulata]